MEIDPSIGTPPGEDEALPDKTLFLEWRSDIGGFLKSEDIAEFEKVNFKLNREKCRFEYENRWKYDYIGYFTRVNS